MSCEDIPSLVDLQKVKKHADDFGRLMGTGIGTSTNEVTGQVRPTYNAVMANLGYTRVGTFASGGTLLNGRQTLLWDVADGGDGQEYGWSGVFPLAGKVVPSGSTPLTTGGIAVGAWMSRFDPELRIQVRESLRRSYAEAGYSLVDGSFEAGGTLVNTNDVLLQEGTGKAFSGPAGVVAAGTNPASGGFVDVSSALVNADSVIVNDKGGQSVSRVLFDKLLDNGVSAKDFGAVGDLVADDTAPFLAARAYSFNVHVPDSPGYLINQDITGNFYGYEDIKFTGSGFITYKNITKPEQPRKIRCIAHRAYTGTVAENTIPAIDIAAKNGADGIEIDVQVTSDGVAVLFHDSNLSLQTSGTGTVSANTFATINGLTYKALAGSFLSDTKIPTLNAALKVVKKYNVECFVEIKGYRTIADVDLILDDIWKSGVASKCSILVNSLADLAAVRTSANPVGQSVTIVIAYADQHTWRAKLSEANEYGGKYEFVMYHNNIRGGGAGMVRAINTFSRLGAYWLIHSGVTNSDSNAAQIASDMIALGVDSLTSDFKIKV